jgi:hypothetical protein
MLDIIMGASGTSNFWDYWPMVEYTTVNVNSTELWNGSAWTEVNDLNTCKKICVV